MVLGIVPAVAERAHRPPSRASCRAPEVDLALWHGVNLPLVLSVVTIAAGAVLFWLRREVARVLAAGERVPSSERLLRRAPGLNVAPTCVTGVVQNGSLPVHAGVVLLTSAVLPGAVLLARRTGPGGPAGRRPAPSGGGGRDRRRLAAATIRRRLSAVLFLGVVGYGHGRAVRRAGCS